MNVTVVTIADLEAIAADVVRRVESFPGARAVLCTLSGDLGAGKTTLTQAIARNLGIVETLQSPTFVIRKRYETGHPTIKQLIHIDAYRLSSGQEIKKIKFEEDLAQPYTLICLEWPEQIADLHLLPDIALQLKHVDETTREITILP